MFVLTPLPPPLTISTPSPPPYLICVDGCVGCNWGRSGLMVMLFLRSTRKLMDLRRWGFDWEAIFVGCMFFLEISPLKVISKLCERPIVTELSRGAANWKSTTNMFPFKPPLRVHLFTWQSALLWNSLRWWLDLKHQSLPPPPHTHLPLVSQRALQGEMTRI